MRGNELLDNMELIDGAYVDAACALPKRKRMSRLAALAACFAVVLLFGGVMLGMALTDPPATSPEDVPSAVIDWDMYAVWVDADGNVAEGQQAFQFSLECTVYDSASRLEYEFVFPEGFRYEILKPDTGASPVYVLELSDFTYYVAFGYQYDFQTEDIVFGYWALSLEKECMIFEWEHINGGAENPGIYLLAFRDPNTDPKEILNYFQGYLDIYSPSGPHIHPGLYDRYEQFSKPKDED